MSLSLSKPIFFIFLLIPLLLQGQEMISGKVLSAKDSTALEGVSVYFDGTSLGTVTNRTGEFHISNEKSGVAPLVISFLGFKNAILNISEESEKQLTIFLDEKEEMLQEVVLEVDPWSRKKKLRIFREEFLGSSPAAADCKIINEEVIQLYYSPSKQVLSAEISEPLEIKNKHLGYHITYDLSLFRVGFLDPPGSFGGRKMVLIEGTSFFEELNESTRSSHEKNRKLEYNGSSLHFMRSLASKQLHENRFRILDESLEVDPYKFFDIKKDNGLIKVQLLTDKLIILYHDIEYSALETKGSFAIDRLGNHTPPLAAIFSGKIALGRVADMLPLDYFPEENQEKTGI